MKVTDANWEALFGCAKAHAWSFKMCCEFTREIFKTELRDISLTQLRVMELIICSGWVLVVNE